MLTYHAPCLEPGSDVEAADPFASLAGPFDHRIHGYLYHSVMRSESTCIPVIHTVVGRIVAINGS